MSSTGQLLLPETEPVPRPGALESWLRARGVSNVFGTDEVGRGPLAGPVVGAAVALAPDIEIVGLDDSKRLNPRQREELAREVRRRALGIAVVELSARSIDRGNILRCALAAMARAARRLAADLGEPDIVLVDGPHPLPLAWNQRPVVQGDHLCQSIAAASVVAKVYRDALMGTLHHLWPAYGFAGNKGYGGAAVHREALVANGPCPLHRLSFKLPGR